MELSGNIVFLCFGILKRRKTSLDYFELSWTIKTAETEQGFHKPKCFLRKIAFLRSLCQNTEGGWKKNKERPFKIAKKEIVTCCKSIKNRKGGLEPKNESVCEFV